MVVAIQNKISQFINYNSTLEMNISIVVTQEEHYKYSQEICETIELSALLRGTGIAKRTLNTSKKDGKQRCSYCIN